MLYIEINRYVFVNILGLFVSATKKTKKNFSDFFNQKLVCLKNFFSP